MSYRLYRYDFNEGHSLGGAWYPSGHEYYITDDSKRKLYFANSLNGPWFSTHGSIDYVNDNPKDYYDSRFFGLIKRFIKCPYTYMRDIDDSEFEDSIYRPDKISNEETRQEDLEKEVKVTYNNPIEGLEV